MSILSIIETLASTPSRLEKEAILIANTHNTVLRDVFSATLNPYIRYNIKQVRPLLPETFYGVTRLDSALLELDVFATRQVTGNAAKQHLSTLLMDLSRDDAEVLVRVIERDLRCGVNIATVNKIWKGCVPVFGVMLAGSDMSKIRYPAYAQLKVDSIRGHVHWDGEQTSVLSRSGQEIKIGDVLDHSAAAVMLPGETVDGELVCVGDDGKILPRKTSSGILNKAIKGTITQEEARSIRFVVWDIIDFNGTIQYEDRWNELSKRLTNTNNLFIPVESMVVNSEKEALAVFKEMLARGEEGIILKNMDSVWEPKRSDNICKLKDIRNATMRCVGWCKGKGRNKRRMGNLVFSSDDGHIVVNVGSGFSDKDRDEITKKNSLGRLANIMYNSVIRSKKKDKAHSLFLPRFVCWEDDKTDADTKEKF